MSNKNEVVLLQDGKGGDLMEVLSFTAEKTMELANANSVMGERIEVDGITVIPVSKVSAGFAGGGADIRNADKKRTQNPAGAGAKVSVTPMTFLVIKEGDARIITINAQEGGSEGWISAVIEQFKNLIKKDSKK